jgi:hypothetical protein
MRWSAEAAMAMAAASRTLGDARGAEIAGRVERRAGEIGMESVQSALVVAVLREEERVAQVTRGGVQRRLGKRAAGIVAGMALALLTATGVAAARPVPAPVGTVAGVYRATACWSLGAKARACVVGESEDDGEAVDIATEMVPDGYYAAGVPVVVTVAWIAG